MAAMVGAMGCGKGKESPKPPDMKATASASAASAMSAASSASAASAMSAGPGTMFPQKAPSLGDKFSQEDSTRLTLSISVDPKGDGHGKKSESDQTSATKIDVEITGADGTTVNKAKANYVAVTNKNTTDGKEATPPSTLQGKTYSVSAKPTGGRDVRDEKGKFLPAAEVALVDKDFGWIGKPMPVAMPTRALKGGDTVDELGAAVKAQLEARKGVTVKTVTATTKTLTPDEGVFALSVVMEQTTDAGMRIDSNLTGDAHVAVKDGIVRDYSITGPAKVSTASGTAKYDGTGTVTVLRKRTPK